ncbi:MAG: CoA transferase [Ideonella sp. WA131b]|jgi:crotonobetainyl-CoA:carnitine CoA-transferase CaiB-like acyl-CoA transferase|nr:CoA transferase [Ideonella sp. WA131b]
MKAAQELPAAQLQPGACGPLQGVRVVDLSRLVAGNMLTLQLGDFGADVIKVEAAGSGDTLREWRESHADFPAGFDGWWRTYARNKRSLALDLRNAEAMAWLRRLIDTAQVLVESFRPGTLEAMGLAPDALGVSNPRLVVVRLSGWGQTGPYRELPGFGSLIEGFSGYAHKHRGADGTPQLPNLAMADMITGLTGAFATLAALREVEVRGGRGQVLDLSLLEPMLAIMGPDVSAFAATGVDAEPGRKIASPRGSYRCKDGLWVSMSGSTDTMARRVFEAIGRPALMDEPRFNTNAARLAHDQELDAMVAGFIAGLDQGECLALFRRHGVTVGPIYAPPQLLADAHVVERGVYVRLDSGDGTEPTVMHQVTPRLQGTPGSIRRAAPARGQHTHELLAELGATSAEREALQRQGAIECS